MTKFAFMTDLDHLHDRRGWLFVLGALMIAIGIAALVFAPFATLGTVYVLGWLITISGIDRGAGRRSTAS